MVQRGDEEVTAQRTILEQQTEAEARRLHQQLEESEQHYRTTIQRG